MWNVRSLYCQGVGLYDEKVLIFELVQGDHFEYPSSLGYGDNGRLEETNRFFWPLRVYMAIIQVKKDSPSLASSRTKSEAGFR